MDYSLPDDSNRGVVAVSNLFPNEYEPRRGLFNLRQFQALAGLVPVATVAPVTWFPAARWIGRRSAGGRRRLEWTTVGGMKVAYPRYFYPPGIGRPVQGHLYYLGARGAVRCAAREVSAMALYGTWAYPDGFAVARMARDLDLPFVVKVHGSDVNDYLNVAWRRRVIVSTLNRASKVVAVSEALKRRMVECGVEEGRISVVYNGVDREVFAPADSRAARGRLGLDGDFRRVLFVGNLKPVKGLFDLIAAFRQLAVARKEAHLHIIGQGPLEQSLRREVTNSALAGRVHFEGEKTPEDIATWMNACDLLCLPSVNEGVPNVILEALSCGLPVVASRVGGIPEVVTSESAGVLVPPRNPERLYEAIAYALDRKWARPAVSRVAEQYSWDANAETLLTIMTQAVH